MFTLVASVLPRDEETQINSNTCAWQHVIFTVRAPDEVPDASSYEHISLENTRVLTQTADPLPEPIGFGHQEGRIHGWALTKNSSPRVLFCSQFDLFNLPCVKLVLFLSKVWLQRLAQSS